MMQIVYGVACLSKKRHFAAFASGPESPPTPDDNVSWEPDPSPSGDDDSGGGDDGGGDDQEG